MRPAGRLHVLVPSAAAPDLEAPQSNVSNAFAYPLVSGPSCKPPYFGSLERRPYSSAVQL